MITKRALTPLLRNLGFRTWSTGAQERITLSGVSFD